MGFCVIIATCCWHHTFIVTEDADEVVSQLGWCCRQQQARQHAMLAHSHYTGQSSNDATRDENRPFQDGASSDDKEDDEHGLN